MNTLIQMTDYQIGNDTVQTVNARDLYHFIEVGKAFAAWIQDRIIQYGFIEHQDYVVTVSKTGIRQNVIQKDDLISYPLLTRWHWNDPKAKHKG
ncbi:antA/AntB antirepressor family protein [Neisseriaceae bacterium TC5R-5]|nr:antA/AntB antirepressor family protein [Neisseriaceae bacterium TC5R-5]